MKILSRKFTAIVLLAIMSISAFAIGVSTLYKPAVAESNAIVLPEDINRLNIEDCITSVDASVANGGFQYAHALQGTDLGALYGSQDLIYAMHEGNLIGQLNSVNKVPKDKFWVGLYTNKAVDTDVYDGNVCNVNKYDGNISIFTTAAGQYKYHQGSLAFLLGGKQNRVVSFRMSYQEGNEFTFRDNVASAYNYNIYNAARITPDCNVTFFTSVNSSDTTITKAELLAKVQETNPDVTKLFETGDDLLITTGSYSVGTEKTYLYLKVVNETKGFVAVEELVEREYCAMRNAYFAIQIVGSYGTSYGYTKTISRVGIAGVNEPIFAGDYSYSVAETLDASYVGQSVTALQLKNDYAHVANTQEVLTAGENVINVKYVADYYGKPMNKDATVTVNVEAPVEINVAINDIDGFAIQTDVITGTEYTLPTFERDKTFIAYLAEDGKIYKQGETVAVTEDTSFTLVEAEFAVKDKIDLRLSKTDYYGGLRYTATVLTADYEILTENGLTFKTVIEPVTGSESGTAKAFADVFVDDIYTCAYFTITELNYYNFNREFAGKIVIEVPYTSGTACVYSNVVIGSAYELASELVAENAQAIAQGQALYNGDAAEIINRYVYGVIDLNCTPNQSGVEITTSENPWFTLESYSVASYQDGQVALNISVNVLDAAADYVNADNYSAPVIVRNNSAEYKPAVVSNRTLENGVLSFTITFLYEG